MLVVENSIYLQIMPGCWRSNALLAQVRVFVTQVLRLGKMNENMPVKALEGTEKQGLKKGLG